MGRKRVFTPDFARAAGRGTNGSFPGLMAFPALMEELFDKIGDTLVILLRVEQNKQVSGDRACGCVNDAGAVAQLEFQPLPELGTPA
jgi:hypothetical protein